MQLKLIKIVLSALTLALVQSASAAVFITPTGASVPDGAVKAVADITLLSGQIQVVLKNLKQNPTADGQLISGIEFVVSGATGSGNLATVNSGNVSQISSGGIYTAGTTDPLLRWKANETGSTIRLTTLSGRTPTRLIIGPDSAAGFVNAGTYNNANPSITGVHNPSILGFATFTITIPGVTPSSELSNVKFEFGTSGVSVTAVPEPSTYIAGLSALGMLGLISWRSRK